MKTIYKYPIKLEDETTIEMPSGAEILSFGVQKDIPCIWTLVETKRPYAGRRFRLAGTGYPIYIPEEEKLEFIGTIQMPGGDLIYHLFEIKTER